MQMKQYRKEGVSFSVRIGSKDNLQRHLLGLVWHHSGTDKSLTGVFSIILQNVLCLMRRDFSLTFMKGFLKVQGAGCILGTIPSALISTPFSVVDGEVSSWANVG